MGWRNFHKAAIYVMVLSAHCVLTLHGQTPKLQNPLGNGPEVVAAGRDVYNNNCTDCHGRDGTQGGRAPALAGDRRYFRLSEAAIFDTIKNGIPGTSMQSLDLEYNDIWRIVAYIRNLRGTASDNIVPGNAEHGARVYANSGCQKCHMILGQGGTIGPDLSSIGGQVTLKHLREALTQETLIPRGYRPVKVTAQNGEVVEGEIRCAVPRDYLRRCRVERSCGGRP